MSDGDDALTVTLAVREESDVAVARLRVRELSGRVGLSHEATEALATAVSEVARNIVVHAGSGELRLSTAHQDGRVGVVVAASDTGPGITDLDRAFEDGFTTAGGLGLGLSGARRLTDELAIESTPGQGTRVTMKKWARRNRP